MNISAPTTYLMTKLIYPQIRRRLVTRRRLLQHLDEVLNVPLCLVCAPPGYGKTTLLVDWVRGARAPVAWLSLDEEENDPVRFLNAFILALQIVHPEVGKSTLAALNATQPEWVASGLPLLLNDLAHIATPFVFVLDDYHNIHNEDVHAMLRELLNHQPGCLHLLIASRVEPPLNLTGLRARGSLFELRTGDLKFNAAETGLFLNEIMGLSLSTQESALLLSQTEGWAAGLQLAALSLRSHENDSETPPLSSGRHYIFEYLAQEILLHQPADVSRFLHYTAIAERLSGPLCDALVPPFAPFEDGAACLDSLEHANLFTQALDGEHTWYRYHALLSTLLLENLRRTEPEALPRLHRQAARWFAAQGTFDQAFKHAVAGKDFELAADLLEQNADLLQKSGQLTTLANWLKAIPETIILERPALCLSRTWIALLGLDTKDALVFLEQAEKALMTRDNPGLWGSLYTARALCFGIEGKSQPALEFAQKALAALPGENHYLYALLRFNMSIPLMFQNRCLEATAELEAAVHAAITSNSPFVALLALRVLGETYFWFGKLHLAEITFRQAVEIVDKEMGGAEMLKGFGWLGLGEVYRQRYDLEQARHYLEAGLAATFTWMPVVAVDGLIWLAYLEQSLGNHAAAQAALQRANLSHGADNYFILDTIWLGLVSAKMNIMQGSLDAALRWAKENGFDFDAENGWDSFAADSPAIYRDAGLIVLARLFLTLGWREKKPGALPKARRLLCQIIPKNEEHGMLANTIESLLLLAQIEQAMGSIGEAQEALHRALDLAAPERILHVFVDEGEPLADLLLARAAKDLPELERNFIAEILPLVNASSRPAFAPVEAPLDELSRRELEVLRWLASGKTNQEIAGGLYLSLNTVKKHTSTILGKLGAKNRTQAVRIARQLKIIE